MTPLPVSIAAAVASFLLLLVVFELIRSRRLRERYALLWLLTGVVLLALSLWRGATCADASASDNTRPPRYLPASSNNTNMGAIVPWWIGLAPRLRALRVASPPPYRGRHQRPGEAGSAVSLEQDL